MTTDQLRASAEQIVEHHKSAVAVDSYCEGALKLAKAWLAEHPADAPDGTELPPLPRMALVKWPGGAIEWATMVDDDRFRLVECGTEFRLSETTLDVTPWHPATNAPEATDLRAEVERLRGQVIALENNSTADGAMWLTASEFEALRNALPGRPDTPSHALDLAPRYIAQLRTQLTSVERERTDMKNDWAETESLLKANRDLWLGEAAKYQSERDTLADQNRRLREACQEFRDSVLHGMEFMDNDNINAVLSVFDETIGAALEPKGAAADA